MSSEDRAAIAAANQKFMDSFARQDSAGIAALYTGGGQLLPGNSEFVTGTAAIQGFWQGAMEMGIKTAELESVELEVHGDTAVEVGKYTLGAIPFT
jgi:ketosteroid isomerase-like protein